MCVAGPAAAPPPCPQRSLLEGQAGTDYVGGGTANYTVDGSAPALTRCELIILQGHPSLLGAPPCRTSLKIITLPTR